VWDKEVIKFDGVVKGLLRGKGNFRLLEHICKIQKLWEKNYYHLFLFTSVRVMQLLVTTPELQSYIQ